MMIQFEKRSTRCCLSAEYLREIISYDAIEGVLRWRCNRSNVRAGDVAGSVKSTGYLAIKIDGRFYKGHRLAWLHCNGVWPSTELDHVDGNKLNNRISNLREATRSQNNWNKPCRGYYQSKSDGQFRAKIRVNGKQTSLGSFPTADEARSAYVAASQKLHGSFSAYHGGQEAGASLPSAASSPGAQ